MTTLRHDILRTVVLPLLLAVGAQMAYADQRSAISVEHYPIADRISQAKVVQFVQDPNGYIWIGTWDGLMRFDGKELRSFKTYPGDSIRIRNHRLMSLQLTHQGNLWCSFFGRHIYYFDTQRCCYRNPLAGRMDVVRYLFMLPDGKAWAVGEDGRMLVIEDHDDGRQVSFTITEQQAPLPFHKRHTEMAFLGGEIYMTVQDMLYHYNTTTGKADTVLQLPNQTRWTIPHTLPDGRLAFSQKGGVSFYTPATGLFEFLPVPTPVVRCVYLDRQQRLWMLGNNSEVFLRTPSGAMQQLPYDVARVETATNATHQMVFEDDYGTVWLQPGGQMPLARYDEERCRLEQAYTYEDGRRRPIAFYMRNTEPDSQHNLWGNIDEVGFCYLSFRPSEFDVIDDMPDMGARAMLLDRQRRLWVGWRRDSKADIGGLAIYDRYTHSKLGYVAENGSLVDTPEKAIQSNIYAMHQDHSGNIWLGTRSSGLFVLQPANADDTRFNVYHYMSVAGDSTSLLDDSVYDFLEDRYGRLWIAVFGGGLHLVMPGQHPAHIRFINKGTGLSRYPLKDFPNIRSLEVTPDERLLIGTNEGLVCTSLREHDPEGMTFYHSTCSDEASSLSCNNIMHLSQLRDGRTLISTFGGGLNVLQANAPLRDSLRFEHYDRRHGNIPDVVYAAIQQPGCDVIDYDEDVNQGYWLMSENGLTRLDADFHPIETFLSGTPCSEAIPLYDDSLACLYLSSRYNVLQFRLNQQKRDMPFVPPIVFTTIEIHLKSATERRSITPSVSQYRLAPDERNFSLMFNALDYARVDEAQYAYRLHKGSKIIDYMPWVSLGRHSTADIVNLPAGHYIIEVRCTDASGQWCQQTACLDIVVEPYFYETFFFLALLCLLALSVVVYAVYRLLRNIEQRREARYASQLEDAKVKFFTQVSHQQTPEEEQFVHTMMQHIEQHLSDEKFSIEATASDLNMSYPVLYRRVKMLMDVTPVELVRRLRIQRASSLLVEQRDLSIAEIARQCGFSTPQYFARVFKDTMQCTPAEYRRKQSNGQPDTSQEAAK